MGGPGSGPGIAKERRQLAAALRAEGLTLTEIGARMGCTKQAAYHLLRKGEAFDEARFWAGQYAHSRTDSFYEAVGVKPDLHFFLFYPLARTRYGPLKGTVSARFGLAV